MKCIGAASACKRRAKKDVARWSDAVCCNHRESNPGLFYIETRRLRQYDIPACELCVGATNGTASRDSRHREGWSTYLLRTARVRIVSEWTTFAARSSIFSGTLRLTVVLVQFFCVIMPLCWQAGILPLDHGCPMYGRVFQMRRNGIAMSICIVCAPHC